MYEIRQIYYFEENSTTQEYDTEFFYPATTTDAVAVTLPNKRKSLTDMLRENCVQIGRAVADVENSWSPTTAQEYVDEQIANVESKAKYGTTAQRPTLTNDDIGYMYFDTTLQTLIVWNGGNWRTTSGNLVS